MSVIVVGVDGSSGSAAALRWAAAEARWRGASLTAVHAYIRPLAYAGTDAVMAEFEPSATTVPSRCSTMRSKRRPTP